MTSVLGFLHTAAAHVATFDAVLDELDPTVPRRHAVAAALLDQARAAGAVTPDIAARVADAVRELIGQGADLVLCTCSTIGAAAEAAATTAVPVLRLDRPMAVAAVACGPRVAVVAALASTVAPTLTLLLEVAGAAGRPIAPRVTLCEEAWPHFERGELERYWAAVAAAARAAAAGADVVVLAQGSMGPAAERLAAIGVPVLASPRLGVAAAVNLWHSARRRP